ncbi:MAG: DUF4431 domain-containing protein [Chlamydiae bacterium]|nr:DUF4431 domain-containing protein [Chlamydiota bacterium]
MLKTYLVLLFALASGWTQEFDQQVMIEGVLRQGEREIIKDPNGKKEVKIERKIVLVTDKPLVLFHSIMLEKQQIASTETSYPHIGVSLPEEFITLIGKRVQCYGNFKRSFDPIGDEIILHVDTVLDAEQPINQLKTVFYEPEEVEVLGLLQEIIYPGPPEYMSIEMGDQPEKTTILTLKEPINVDIKKEDGLNEPEQGVRQLEVVFPDSVPTDSQMKEEITLKGTLFHSHTGHHHRRVLIMVKSWSVK